MPINVLRGPAGGGKSQWLEENVGNDAIILDTTRLWAALLNIERDAEGRYRERLRGEPGLNVAQYLKWTGLRLTAREGLDAWFTLASSSPEAITRIQRTIEEFGARIGRIATVDPGIQTSIRRLAISLERHGLRPVDKPTAKYGLSDECEEALARWYGHTPLQTAYVRMKIARQWRREPSRRRR